MLRNMLRNCKDEIRVPLLKRRLLKGALCLRAGLLSPPYGTGGGGGGVDFERVVAHNPQPPQKDNGITTDLFNTYGYLVAPCGVVLNQNNNGIILPYISHRLFIPP